MALATGASDAGPTTSGTIHTGVGSEDEARAFPCPGETAEDAGRTGPVVCLDPKGDRWVLTSDASGDCTEGPMGWQGECIHAFRDGDVLRVWGTRGIPPTAFTVTWATGSVPPPPPASSSTTSRDGTDGDDADGDEERSPVVARQPSSGTQASTTRTASTGAASGSSGGLTAGSATTGDAPPAEPATPEVAAPTPSPDPLAGSHAAGRMPPRAYQPPIGPAPSPFRTGGLATTGLLALAAGGWALRQELRERRS